MIILTKRVYLSYIYIPQTICGLGHDDDSKVKTSYLIVVSSVICRTKAEDVGPNACNERQEQ